MTEHAWIWTPQDMPRLARLNPPKAAYRMYGVATQCADRRTGSFILGKRKAASLAGCCKETADRGLAALVECGVVKRNERIRSKRQRTNEWRLVRSVGWAQTAANAKADYHTMMEQLRQRKAAKQAQLQLLDGRFSQEGGTTAVLSYDETAQLISKKARQEGWDTDWNRYEREIEFHMSNPHLPI